MFVSVVTTNDRVHIEFYWYYLLFGKQDLQESKRLSRAVVSSDQVLVITAVGNAAAQSKTNMSYKFIKVN